MTPRCSFPLHFALMLFLLIGCDVDIPGRADTPEREGGAPVSQDGPDVRPDVATEIAYAAPTREPTKWALIVGINSYPTPKLSDLAGCINDAQRMRALLVGKFGFPTENVLVLTDEDATREGILDAFQNHLIANAERDDIVVFHYSGHGSQMKDVSGDETDGLDETIVPHDSRQEGVFDINDDELNDFLEQLLNKTRNVTLILDSCHSGTGVRAAGRVRAAPNDERAPPDVQPAAQATEATTRGDAESTLRRANLDYVLLSAARSDQFAYETEVDGAEHGTFTYYLTQELERAGAGTTYRDVADQIRSRVSTLYPRQEPQFEGTTLDRYVFSDSSSLAQPYVLASPRNDGRVALEAGSVHGLTEGSTFDVYPPGTKTFAAPAEPIARVELTRVIPFRSQAQIVEGGPIPDLSRAVERERVYPNQQLHVHYADVQTSPVLQDVRARLDSLSHIETVVEPHGYHLLLREEDGKIVTEGADATLFPGAVPASEPGAAARVAGQVKQWARWFNLLSLTNPSPKSSISFTIEAFGEGGSRDPFAQPDRSEAELFEGEEFACTVENTSGHDLYITILDLATDGSVTPIYPYQEGASELLPAGQSVTRRFSAYVPEDRTSVKDIIKVFATSTPVDFQALTQPGIRSASEVARAAEHPLEQLLAQAALGTTRQVRPIALGDWVTAQRAFTVRSRGEE